MSVDFGGSYEGFTVPLLLLGEYCVGGMISDTQVARTTSNCDLELLRPKP